MSSDIKIQAYPQADTTLCNFVLENNIESFGIYSFNKANMQDSALAREIFAIDSVVSVIVMGDTITVKKSNDAPWPTIAKEIGKAIRAAFASGDPMISDSLKNKSETELNLKTKTEEVIVSKINPQIASHGGFIELWDVKNNDIFIKMGGGCQGCSSSAATLKQGVEVILKDEIPGLEKIVDTTDHTAGTNPYY